MLAALTYPYIGSMLIQHQPIKTSSSGRQRFMEHLCHKVRTMSTYSMTAYERMGG